MSFLKKTVNNVTFFVSDLLPCPHAFSTRLGGISTLPHLFSMNLGENRGDAPENPAKNFKKILLAANLPENCVSALQIHSKKVLYVKAPFEEKPSCDGFFTNRENLTLCVKVADCLPLLLYDPQARVIAALHAGWRGSAQNIAGEGVLKMKSLGAEPENIRVAIGPSIGKCCFAVRQDFIEEFTALAGADLARRFISSKEGEQPHADLKHMNKFLLLEAGIKEEHIDLCPLCTCCNPTLFFSHRASHGQRGTMGALIALPAFT